MSEKLAISIDEGHELCVNLWLRIVPIKCTIYSSLSFDFLNGTFLMWVFEIGFKRFACFVGVNKLTHDPQTSQQVVRF